MRKMLYAVIITVIAISSLACSSMAADAGSAKDVSVVDMKGTVEVMEKGASNWVAATAWMKLGAGDTVRTGKDSYADLKFNGMGDTALVRVGENSSMKVDTYVSSKDVAERKIALDLSMGDVLVKANKLKSESQFQVKTPTSIVGVRGTGFKVHVESEK